MFWLKYGRRWFSWVMNFALQGDRKPLPVVSSIEGVKSVLSGIRYVPDKADWIQRPELTWGLRRGDCEDFAALAMALLKQIGVNGYLLSVICRDRRLSHAVCVFTQDSKYSYFSNARFEQTKYTQITQIVTRIGGNQVIYWSLENINGKILRKGKKC